MVRKDLETALAVVGRHVKQPLKLDPRGACGLRIGGVPGEIVVEWIEKAQLVAVHAHAAITETGNAEVRARVLMRAHLAGGATMGCTFWETPKGEVRIGALILGPTIDQASLLEAIGRVGKVLERLATDPTVRV